ncbi:hypothetical protein DU478_12625 [Thalassococcus profundi]|uniref:Uncharacterized protein n=1 Tax=Thalassococcus profundi TaxID=2282382 RepID=A0A369TS38_9RHOB|nr:hypothetical protein [Thalassococcus profundi]RDD65766.1 hypothetical protein DU478_12625 [Thalassococcus profundi]
MFLELIAVAVAGFAGAGAIMALRLVLGDRLPRWLVPVGAGLAMLAATISSEYNWFSRTAGALPEGVVVADSVTDTAPWRPWTYLVPLTDRFVAVDTGNLVQNEEQGLYMADLYFFGRWKPVQSVQMMIDCADGRRADPALGDGSDPVWRDVGSEDPIVRTVCSGG